MPLPPVGPVQSYAVTTGPSTPYSGTRQETFDPADTLDLTRDGGSLFAAPRPFAPRPTGSTGNFLYVGPQGQRSATIDFAQAAHYYGFLWGSPDRNPADPSQRQGVELYSGAELVAVYTADSLGLDGDTRFVSFHASEDKPFTRAVLFAHTGFETDNHATYTVQPAQAPTVSAPARLALSEDTTGAVIFGATPFADPDSAQLSVTLEVADGTLGVVGAAGVTVGGTAVRRTFSGTVADLNAYFTTAGNISYTPPADANGSRTLKTSVTDGSLSASADTLLQIAAVNDAPVLALPATQAVDENDELVFSPANGNAVSVSDVDSGLSDIELQLGVSNGTLRLSGVAGLTLVAGADGSASMTWRGRASDLDAALAGMRYAPARDYNGPATLSVFVSDLGNTGSGQALTRTGSVAIVVNPTDSAPTVNVPDSFRVAEDRMSPLAFTGTPFGDADSTLLTVTLSIADGTLAGSSGNGVTLGGSPTARTFTGTVANLNAYFTRPGSIAYATAPNNTADRILTTTVSDGNRSTESTSLVRIDAQPAQALQPRPQVLRQAAWTPAEPRPTGVMTFERSTGPTSADGRRPVETFEPGVARSLEVSGGALAGPTTAAVPWPMASRDPSNHRMVVGPVAGSTEVARMTVDVSARATTTLGFDWGGSRQDQSVELYSGSRLLGRWGAFDVFADAPRGASASGYVTFRSLDGAPITKAVFASSSPFEVDNITTDPTDLVAQAVPARAAPASPGRAILARLAPQGAGAGAEVSVSPARRGSIPGPAAMVNRALALYGAAPGPRQEAVLSENEIQARAQRMGVEAMVMAVAPADRESLERAYAMRW